MTEFQPFEPLTDEEYEALKASIAEKGLLVPITRDQSGAILDGHHRERACRELGIEPRYEVQFCADDSDRKVRALVMNLLRRHLTREQKAKAVAELRGLGYTFERIAAETGIPARTAHDLITESDEFCETAKLETGSDDTPQTVTGKDGKVYPARKPRKPKPGLTVIQAKNAKDAERASEALTSLPDPPAVATMTANEAIRAAKHQQREQEKKERAARDAATAPTRAAVTLASWADWLPAQPDCDLLITDPPYSTDIDDIHKFAGEWLPVALGKVKPTGRAYVCVGAYPAELLAYLAIEPPEYLNLANVLVWTYRNTLGPKPTHDYKLNWQAILYYRGVDAPPLDCPEMVEQFSVQDINAPDGRRGDRWHAWQKPDLLAERLIRHSTRPGDVVLDPFAGTGTFLLAAARLGRQAAGCEIDPAHLAIAEERGCERA